MNDVQLRSFTAAVELGSFNKAAKGQFLSVPSFAQRINSLEAELGYRILERGPSGVRPTDAGLVLYRAAKEALDILDKAREEGRIRRGGATGRARDDSESGGRSTPS